MGLRRFLPSKGPMDLMLGHARVHGLEYTPPGDCREAHFHPRLFVTLPPEDYLYEKARERVRDLTVLLQPGPRNPERPDQLVLTARVENNTERAIYASLDLSLFVCGGSRLVARDQHGQARFSGGRVATCAPGYGVLMLPDSAFQRDLPPVESSRMFPAPGRYSVHLEARGDWSRDAVWIASDPIEIEIGGPASEPGP